jgi:hypothetical protein
MQPINFAPIKPDVSQVETRNNDDGLDEADYMRENFYAKGNEYVLSVLLLRHTTQRNLAF